MSEGSAAPAVCLQGWVNRAEIPRMPHTLQRKPQPLSPERDSLGEPMRLSVAGTGAKGRTRAP